MMNKMIYIEACFLLMIIQKVQAENYLDERGDIFLAVDNNLLGLTLTMPKFEDFNNVKETCYNSLDAINKTNTDICRIPVYGTSSSIFLYFCLLAAAVIGGILM